MQPLFRSIGLMSGTSCDGIDAALIETDGKETVRILEHHYMPYSDTFQKRLIAACSLQKADLGLEEELTHLHSVCVHAMQQKAEYIAFHGHTILHAPDKGITHQIGDGRMLSQLCKLPVIYNFRIADVKAGGQGAPLVPLYHKAVTSHIDKPLAVLNIGGVANITYIGETDLMACDVGVGNAPLNDWMRLHTGLAFDENGACAARGKIDYAILNRWTAHDFFKKKPPKSLDRNSFSLLSDIKDLSVEDGAATLTAFTAHGIGASIQHFPIKPQRIILCGGGRKNIFLKTLLQDKVKIPFLTAEEIGVNGDMVEAEAFAYLGIRRILGLPSTYPTTTGCLKSTICGEIA